MDKTTSSLDSCAFTLDIQQLQLDVQHRWLHPSEIVEILRNYQMFQMSTKPPDRPPNLEACYGALFAHLYGSHSLPYARGHTHIPDTIKKVYQEAYTSAVIGGSLFLFNRKVLRNFRKDGHIWSKAKDGKTVKEAHENLKVGSVNVLHCYYAIGEENPCFKRRVYWLLQKNFRDIIFVHYLEVKRRSTSKKTRKVISNSQLSNSFASSVLVSHNEAYAGIAGSPSAARTLTCTNEDIESGVEAKMDQNRTQEDKNAQI